MTKLELENLYITQNLGSEAIAEKIGKSAWWVRDKLHKFGIPKKKRGNQGIIEIEFVGERFGNYTVLSRSSERKDRWLCRCDCGNVKEVFYQSLIKGTVRHCDSCIQHRNWKGYKEISASYFGHLRAGAKRRKLDFEITIEYIWEIYEAQNKKCALSGLELNFTKNYTNNVGGQTASLDRIDSKLGYIKGNVRWVHKNVNVMRWNMTDEYFLELCKRITNFNLNKSWTKI